MDSRPLRVILVDDDEDDYLITRDLLSEIESQEYDLEWVTSYYAGLEAIGRNEHDIYLIDYHLGERNGLELLRQALQDGCEAPVLLLTGQGDREVDIEAMKAGAADYLVKGQINAALLERSVRYAIERKRSDQERAKLEEQLLQSQKLQAVGTLAGGVAHEFNNLLTPILGFTKMVLDSPTLEDRARDRLQVVHNAATRAAELVLQLLAFSRQEIIETRVINLRELILGIEKMIRHLISEDIELTIEVTDDLRLIKTDPGRMEQVLVNLAVNARDAMPNGGKLIIKADNATLTREHLHEHPQLTPGEYVTLTVQDSGIGMTEQVREHIFEPFFTTKEVGKGTGLGLSTCHGIISQNGGGITVDSAPERGTRFTIYLPQVDEAADELPQPDAEPLTIPSGNETIILVEDEQAVREVTASMLREQGYTVFEAFDGANGLNVAKELVDREIHLLLTDVVMPHINGRELAERVLTIHPETRVLYISGYTSDILRSHDVSVSLIGFLQKPFTCASLAHKIREVLDAREQVNSSS